MPMLVGISSHCFHDCSDSLVRGQLEGDNRLGQRMWTDAAQAADLRALVLCSAFFECADNMGIFEWNTVSNTFVKFFANITGYVSVAPGDDEVLVVGYDSNVNVLKPQGMPVSPSIQYMEIPHHSSHAEQPPRQPAFPTRRAACGCMCFVTVRAWAASLLRTLRMATERRLPGEGVD